MCIRGGRDWPLVSGRMCVGPPASPGPPDPPEPEPVSPGKVYSDLTRWPDPCTPAHPGLASTEMSSGIKKIRWVCQFLYPHKIPGVRFSPDWSGSRLSEEEQGLPSLTSTGTATRLACPGLLGSVIAWVIIMTITMIIIIIWSSPSPESQLLVH